MRKEPGSEASDNCKHWLVQRQRSGKLGGTRMIAYPDFTNFHLEWIVQCQTFLHRARGKMPTEGNHKIIWYLRLQVFFPRNCSTPLIPVSKMCRNRDSKGRMWSNGYLGMHVACQEHLKAAVSFCEYGWLPSTAGTGSQEKMELRYDSAVL